MIGSIAPLQGAPMARFASGHAAESDRRFRAWPLLLAIALVGGGTAVMRGQTFRSSVDVIAVDVQVIDNDSYPIGPLDAKAFEVSINKQRRKVITAQFIRHSWNEAAMPPPAGLAALNQDAEIGRASCRERVKIEVVAVDM